MSTPSETTLVTRMKLVFDEAEPTSAEMYRGMLQARNRRRVAQRSKRKRGPKWLVALPLVLIGGSAFAYVGVRTGHITLPMLPPSIASESKSDENARGLKTSRFTSFTDAPDLPSASRDEPARSRQDERAEPKGARVPPVHLHDLDIVEPHQSHTHTYNNNAPIAARPTRDAPSGVSWVEVTTALRDGNQARAMSLLEQLSENGSTSQKQSAQLLLLQLKKKSNSLDPNDQTALRDLSQDGVSSSIRDSASRLLAKPETKASSANENE